MLSIFKKLFAKPVNHELKEAIETGAFIVDVRSEAEFAAGSFPFAVNIPLPTIRKQLDRFRDQKRVIVFCHSGGRSASAKALLTKSGIEGVINGGSLRHMKTVKDG